MTAVRKSPKDSAHRDRDVTTELAIERRLATPNVEVIAMENENNPHEVLNTHDVARIMKCGVRKVQRLAALGQLPMRLFGAEYVITRKRLQEYLES